MRILVCNDDGIDAPGLALLEKAADALGDEVWCVAPAAKRTAAGSSLTIGKPLTLQRVGARRYACSGTPADCVVAAMCRLFDDGKRPDLVLSGINDGRNVAEDLAYSGTLGVAREACFWGLPAIAVSRIKQAEAADGDLRWILGVLQTLWHERENWVAEGHWLSINLPAKLPAAFGQPGFGRDKIARQARLVEEDGDRTVIEVVRGREHATNGQDENHLIASGHATIQRLRWFAETALPTEFVERVSADGIRT